MHLRGGELRVARQHALLPGHLVEVAVVEHEHDEARVAPAVAVLRDVDQRVDARSSASRRRRRARSPAGRGARTWPRARTARAGPIVASVPESAPRIPRRKRRWRAYQLVPEPESAVTMQPSGQARGELPEDPLRVERLGGDLGAGRPAAATSARSRLRSPRASERSVLRCEQREQRAQRLARVADEVDLHRVADAEHARVEVDLHAARLARLGQELGVREAEPIISSVSQPCIISSLGLRAEQADRAGDERQVVGQHVAAVERLGDPGAEPLGDLDRPRRRPRARPGRPGSRRARRR